MKEVLFSLVLLASFSTNAQNEKFASVTGRVVAHADNVYLTGIDVYIPCLKIATSTDTSGIFNFAALKYGSYTLIIKNNVSCDTIEILVDSPAINIGTIIFGQNEDINTVAGLNMFIAMENNDINDEDGQSISGILSASRDPYILAAALHFGPFYYQPRGYNRDQLEVYLNGIQMNDAETGTASSAQWSGSADMFKNRHTLFGLQASENGFGGLSGSANINATAWQQQKQTRLTYAVANSVYRNALMFSHSSGVTAKGWAYAVSLSRRWAKEGYVPGTFYDGYAFYAGMSKRLNALSIVHFTAFGTPVKSGKTASATLEAMELAGTRFYNPNWGYQNGVKRNAKINNSFQPIFILGYEYIPDNTAKVTLAASFQKGYNGNSALDWYNAEDPRPDNYKRLPSYYETDIQTADPDIANVYRMKWLTDEGYRQIDWTALYAANDLNIDVINGMSGKRSVYMIGEDRDDIRKYSFAGNLQKTMDDHINFTAGFVLTYQQTESYRRMEDLLGGDYYVNLNQFAERTYAGNGSFNQNDLNNPDGIVKTGSKYSYDYKARFLKTFIWGQFIHSQNKMDWFIAVRAGQDGFQREGLFKNGLFADDSYGKSATQRFFNYQLKGGVTYKPDERNYLFVNVALITKPPMFDNTFISPKTRNTTVDAAKNTQIKSMEGGYMIHAPKLNGRLTGFATDINNSTEIMRFYHEDYHTFVNYVMRNVDIRHIGGELALQAKLSESLSATAVAALMQVFYTSDPEINIYRDNDTSKHVPRSIAYLRNTYVDAGPQSAYTVGLNYRSRRFGYISVNGNYLNRNYINVNPSRRTEEAVELLTPGSMQWHAIVDQEVLKTAFTIDLFAGKSIFPGKSIKGLPKGTLLYINIGLKNVLNNRNIPTMGSEQLRVDFKNNNPERFPTKYTYGYGTNYSVSVSLKF